MHIPGVAHHSNITQPLLQAKVYSGRFLCAGTKAYDEIGDVINISQENLEKIARTHVGIPVVIDHIEITRDNIANQKVGYVSRVFINDAGFEAGGKNYPADNWAWCDFIIENQEAVDLLDKYGWELSNSYLPIERIAPHNSDYDTEIIGGKGLHLAIVEKGRYNTKIVRHNKKQQNNNLSNKTMNLIKNAKEKIFSNKMYNEEEKKHKMMPGMKHEKKNAEKEIMEERGEKKNNYHGKKFRDNEGNEYDAEEVMNAVTEHLAKEYTEDILPMDGHYDINDNPWTGHDLIEYFKNIKNEEKEMEKRHMMKEEVVDDEDDEEEEEIMTLEEKIEKEKRNNSAKYKKYIPSNNFNKIREAKSDFLRNNSAERGKAVIVQTDEKERMNDIFRGVPKYDLNK